MATIKSYTSLEQSRKLAEILPLESADMHYSRQIDFDYFPPDVESFYPTPFYKDEKEDFNYDIPCWSLASLLGVLPFHLIINNQRYAFSMHKGLNKNGETYMIRYNIFDTDICLYKTKYYNSPIDAAYEMILKLSELNLL